MPEDAFVRFDVDLLLVVDREPASVEQGPDVLGDLDLSRVRASHVMAESRERADVATHGLDGQGGRRLLART